MPTSRDAIIEQLQKLHLTTEEASIYLELLREPSTHLRLAHTTGINRTKIYRLAEQLKKRQLISVRRDAGGTVLAATDPTVLETSLIKQEKLLQEQRDAFSFLMPNLMAIKEGDSQGFVVRTYQGTEGFKQMVTHELETVGEMLILGSGTLADLIEDTAWTDRHRARTLELTHSARLLLNPGSNLQVYTFNMASVRNRFGYRILPPGVMYLQNQIVTYNDTTAIYHWQGNSKTGIEIINKNYATLIRQIFEHYWEMAGQYGGTKIEPVL